MQVNNIGYSFCTPHLKAQKIPQNGGFSPAFTSSKIFDVAIKKMNNLTNEFEFSPATFEKFHINNPNDCELMHKINLAWNDTFLGAYITDLFEKKYLLNSKDLSGYYGLKFNDDGISKPISLVILNQSDKVLFPNKKCLKIDMLQVAPECEKIGSFKRVQTPLKGCGEMTVYSIVKLAKATNIDVVFLESTADLFYKKIGFGDTLNSKKYLNKVFYMERKDFDKFLSQIENKYNIK